MALKYRGEILNGIINRTGAHASGNSHFVLQGKMLCPSGLNFAARDLNIRAFKPTVKNCRWALERLSCKKCNKKLAELIEQVETKWEAS